MRGARIDHESLFRKSTMPLDDFFKYIKENTPATSKVPQGDIARSLYDGFNNNPDNQKTVDAMKGMFGLLPGGAGDVASGLLAADDVRRGDYLSAGLNGVGVLPYVPSIGQYAPVLAGMIKTSRGTFPETRSDVNLLSERLGKLLNQSGAKVYDYSKSNMSPSTYHYVESPLSGDYDSLKVRVSDHADVHSDGEWSVAPGDNSFEEILQKLRDNRINVANKVKPPPRLESAYTNLWKQFNYSPEFNPFKHPEIKGNLKIIQSAFQEASDAKFSKEIGRGGDGLTKDHIRKINDLMDRFKPQ